MTFDLAALVRLIARSTPGHPGYDQGIAGEIDAASCYMSEGMSASARLSVIRAATLSLLVDHNERHGSFAVFERAVYTAGELVGLPRPQIDGVWRAELAAAVDDDHRCNDQSCDPCEAATHGWTHVAAGLLVGATEVERTADVLKRWGLPWDLFETDDWLGWVAHVERYGRRCADCRALTFADDVQEPEACACCLQPLTVES